MVVPSAATIAESTLFSLSTINPSRAAGDSETVAPIAAFFSVSPSFSKERSSFCTYVSTLKAAVGAGETVTEQVAVFSSPPFAAVTVTVHVPAATATTSPSPLTVATATLSDDQENATPSAAHSAISVSLFPASRVSSFLFSAIFQLPPHAAKKQHARTTVRTVTK